MRARLFWGLLLLAATVVLPASADEKLGIVVSPRMSMAPATVRIRFNIERHADNRVFNVAMDCGSFYRSSTIPIDGENGPATVTVEYDNLPQGEYVVSGVLMGASQHRRAAATREMVVN